MSGTRAIQGVLQRRAIQCSFSSVFHVKSTGSYKEGKEFERIFINFVGLPLGVMGVLGSLELMRRRRKLENI